MSFPFNVRVYGALVFEGFILLSDEVYKGMAFTKLPGGGLEYGEGLRDALKREFLEETGIKVNVLEHLYTTDFFQPSAFNPAHQVISVYYKVSFAQLPEGLPKVVHLEKDQTLRWKKLMELIPDDFTFPIDKQLTALLKGLR